MDSTTKIAELVNGYEALSKEDRIRVRAQFDAIDVRDKKAEDDRIYDQIRALGKLVDAEVKIVRKRGRKKKA